MELRHLRYFVAVAEEKNLSRAAQKLHIQQPPLSQQIRAMENELGFELFHRHPKGVDLSVGGAVFLVEAKSILDSVQQAQRRAQRAASGIEGVISVGLTSSAASHPLVPQILSAFRNRFPAIEINFREGNAAELSNSISSGKLDVAFLRMPVSKNDKLAYQVLDQEELLLVLPINHPLLKRNAKSGSMPIISLKSLPNEQFILVRTPGAPGMYSNLIDACKAIGFTPNITVEIDRMLTNICLVAAGVGVSIVPYSMRGLHADRVVYCRIQERVAGLTAPLTLASSNNPPSPANQHFLASAIQFLSQ